MKRRTELIIKIRLENISVGLETKANPENYIEGTEPVWEKFQAALDAVAGFDFENPVETMQAVADAFIDLPVSKMTREIAAELNDIVKQSVQS